MNESSTFTRDGTSGQSDSGRPGYPVDPFRIRRALWSGRRLLIGAGLLGVVIAFAWVKLMMLSGYETMAVLKYEGDLEVAGIPSSLNAIAPAANALMQQSVLRQIAEEVNYHGSLTSLRDEIGYGVNLTSNTVEIAVGGETGEDAADFARTVTDVFLSFHKERQSRRLEGELARTAKRIDASEHEVEIARRKYNVFREEHGIADLSTEQQSMVHSAAKLRADSELAVSETRALEAQVRTLETHLATTPKTNIVSGGTSPERAAYNRLRGELASAKATLSPSHPQVQALQQQVDQLRAQLRSGGGESSGGDGVLSVNSSYQLIQSQLRNAKARLEALRERQKGLSAMADKAQSRVDAFSDIEGEASALLAEVKVNENLIGGLRRTEAAIEDALRDPPSGFVVLDPGAVPEYPVRNKMKPVLFGAIVLLSLALALLLVLRREFRGLRLETPAEVSFWGSGPVLASTPWPNDPLGLDELVAGLDDFLPRASGNLLVLGGTPKESRLATELAERLNTDWFSTDEGPGMPAPQSSAPSRSAPLQTAAPSGPYPIRPAGSASVALARRPSGPPVEAIRLAAGPSDQLQLRAWDGPHEGQALRRAARLADRLVVLVRSQEMSALGLSGIQNRVGRKGGIGYVVIGLPDELTSLPDRIGDVTSFWRA